jgi:hypothetical protein
MSIETRLRDAAGAVQRAVTEVAPAERLGQLRRTRRRRSAALAATAVAAWAMAVAVAGLVVARQDAPPPAGPAPATVGAPREPAGRVVATIPVAGGGPREFELAAGAGAVWVWDDADGLTRVDPATGRPARVLGPRFRDVTGIAAGVGAVWVTHTPDAGRSWDLARVDAASGRVTKAPEPGTRLDDASLAGGLLWGADPANGLVAADPADGRRLQRVGFAAAELAGDDTSLVAVAPGGGAVVRVDPRSGDLSPLPHGGGKVEHAAVGGGAAWLTHGDGWVTRVDLAGGPPRRIRVVDGGLDGIAYGAGGVWVASAACAVYRLDPASGQVLGLVSGTGPALPPQSHLGRLVTAGGAVWVEAYLRGRAHLLKIAPGA